jgi:phosphate transport system permease protein
MILIFLFITILSAIYINSKLKIQRVNFIAKKKIIDLSSHFAYCFALCSCIATIFCLFFLSSLIAKIISFILIILFNYFLINFLFNRQFLAKKHFEKFQILILSITAGIGIFITAIITISILLETLRFFKFVSPLEFFFGLNWNPQMAITTEQEVGKSSFGIIPVFLGTLLITLVAMMVAIPTGIMSAIYLSFYAKQKTRDILKPVLEILAGVPTVVYGYFAVTLIAPFFKNFFNGFGVEISSESALSAGFVMGIMIIPFVLSLTDDAINSVPQSLKDGALALGSTKSEMIKKVVLVSAMPSIVGAIILAVSRAIGETMIVVMSAGLIAKLSFNPLDSVTTATAQIVTLLVGDQEFNSPKTLSAFALALTLFIFTFVLNIIALAVIKKYKNR